MANPEDDRLFEILFNQLVMSLTEAAMMQLGKILNPESGKAERNLAQARGTIDLLRMLKAKTEQGLSEPEKRLLDQNLLNLQMNYVYESEQHPQESQAAEAASERPAAKENQPASAPEPETPEAGEELPPGSRPGQNN